MPPYSEMFNPIENVCDIVNIQAKRELSIHYSSLGERSFRSFDPVGTTHTVSVAIATSTISGDLCEQFVRRSQTFLSPALHGEDMEK